MSANRTDYLASMYSLEGQVAVVRGTISWGRSYGCAARARVSIILFGIASTVEAFTVSHFWGLYQPNGGLPSGMRASAIASATAGGQIVVLCNETSPTSLTSYVGE